ncbi:CGNR zinc finger domain-containing protein [Ruania suaedae]|uniref:CGNR zinc finger domain-containing protein n=1 Tax=Ruania suaedae TaxID=2897774 RepID=UPI001E2A63DA|nr:CGNR zinc finger domain-containing protein [Ruania suaedae]UFU01691.1 CGNR zinc finger domain-containing protein [Ruania suaedae]
MPTMVRSTQDDEHLLLTLLNSTPMEAGAVTDLLADSTYTRALARDLGGEGTEAEVRELRRIREPLQASTIDGAPHPDLDLALAQVVQRPLPLSADGLRWELEGPIEKLVAARVVIAWAQVTLTEPRRLRPCGNDECRLFLIDHSKSNTARWCSMAVCGNRMKARRHHARQRPPS